MKEPAKFYWKNILSVEHSNPPNQYLWWDMYYQYKEDLEIQFGILEESEVMREEKEEFELIKEDNLIQDKKLLKKKLEQQQKIMQADSRNRQYCQDLIYEKKCILPNPFDWSAWYFD
eukprot:TRINITY_DN6558_c0_g1_i3.p3 TRINITY_DN6558_c0_g1~~TRINITY_DN6558_c0_g1_i3.p3  ORF type:complete len:117 (-),score=26.20 TRINITY_DN6558_c0_g1_i3:82-432(-)